MSALGGKADIAQGRVTGGLRGQGQPWFRHRIRLAFDTDRPESVIDPLETDSTREWDSEKKFHLFEQPFTL